MPMQLPAAIRAQGPYFTVDILDQLPEDGNRYEVVSPSSARADRFTKRRRYQEAGVPLYWIVDSKPEAVEVWTPQATLPVIATTNVIWAPAGAEESLVVEVAELFAPVE